MKFSIIRVLRDNNGQHCVVEYELDNKIDADYIAACMNKQYATNSLNWVVDSYSVA